MAKGKGDGEKKGLPIRVTKFAREYVQLVEALKREGVPEDVAREEARIAATTWLFDDLGEAPATYDPALGPCPTCGRG